MHAKNRRDFLKLTGSVLAFTGMVNRLSSAAVVEQPQELGPLPPWTPGTLDIHHISTGRGSCAFLLCPDGTTLMIDAGSVVPHLDPVREKYLIEPFPNGSLRPGQWIARYVQRCLQEAERNAIDYVLLTHFHSDHIGEVAPGNTVLSPLSKYGNYQLGGLTDVAELIPIRTVIDRNYPTYDYPLPLTNSTVDNYRAFGQSFIARGGRIECIVPGALDQIKLLQHAERYPAFSIRNLAANGVVWTGTGQETHACFPPLTTLPRKDYPTENKCSLAIRLNYGKFSYFSAGDMDHEIEYGHLPWGDIETVVARASGPVNIAVANHHGWVDACGPDWVRALRAKVYVINAWDSAHPTMPALNNMLSTQLYPEPRMVFSTAMRPENAIAIRRIAEMKSIYGHVIFRVAHGGESFQIFVKDSSVENGNIVAQYGPISCS